MAKAGAVLADGCEVQVSKFYVGNIEISKEVKIIKNYLKSDQSCVYKKN